MFQITNPRRFVQFLLVVLLVAAVVIIKFSLDSAVAQQGGRVSVEEGQSANAVWVSMVEANLTKSTLPWRYWAFRLNATPRIQAGTYLIEEGERVRDVIGRLVAGDVVPSELSITYPEGFTLKQVAARTAARGIGSEEEFLAAAKPEKFADEFPFLADVPAGRTLEGYLFPDTYRVHEDDVPEDVIRRMLATFDRRFTQDLRVEAEVQGRTVDDVVIMASIVEREVLSDEDMAVVAGILWKRLDEGVGLDADATIRFVLDKWDGVLTVQDLAVDSPYNTRKYRGLPPGPISNPGLRALTAAVRPQTSDFYYYLSAPDGQTVFSKTNDEHNANKVRYLR